MVEFFEKLTFGLAIGVGVIVSVLFFFFFYDNGSDLDSMINNKNIEYGLKEKERERLKKDIEEGLSLKERVASIGAQFKEAFDFLPTDFGAEKLIAEISKQAQVSGATVIKMAPQKEAAPTNPPEVPSDKIYEAIAIDFELKGSFSSLSLFLANISKIKRILDVEELKFVNPEEDSESPIINLNGRIVGYRYLSPEEVGKDVKK